jgi:hypothetical protein
MNSNHISVQPGLRQTDNTSLRAKWSVGEEKLLIDTLIAEVRRGKRADSSFKVTSFALVQQRINAIYQTTYELQRVRNKYSALKKDYDIFSALKSNSGFGWDEGNQLVTADEVWERYLKV